MLFGNLQNMDSLLIILFCQRADHPERRNVLQFRRPHVQEITLGYPIIAFHKTSSGVVDEMVYSPRNLFAVFGCIVVAVNVVEDPAFNGGR